MSSTIAASAAPARSIFDDRADDIVTLDDVSLANRFFELIRGVDNDAVSDAMYFTLDELLERFAPAVATESQRRSIDESISDPGQREKEMAATLSRMAHRRSLRVIARVEREKQAGATQAELITVPRAAVIKAVGALDGADSALAKLFDGYEDGALNNPFLEAGWNLYEAAFGMTPFSDAAEDTPEAVEMQASSYECTAAVLEQVSTPAEEVERHREYARRMRQASSTSYELSPWNDKRSEATVVTDAEIVTEAELVKVVQGINAELRLILARLQPQPAAEAQEGAGGDV